MAQQVEQAWDGAYWSNLLRSVIFPVSENYPNTGYL